MAILAEEKRLNLYNFDKPDAENSRYVLTSPRSLEACSRLKVKPLTLLPKPIKVFEKEHTGKSVELVKILYDQWNRKRLKNLERCRKARDHMIKEDYVNTKKIKSNNKPSTVIEVAEKKIEIPKPKPSYNQPNKVYKYTTSLPDVTGSKKASSLKSLSFSRKLKYLQKPVKDFSLAPTLQMQTDKKIIALLKGRFDQEEKDEVRKYDEWKKWQEEQKFINNKKRREALELNKSIATSRVQWQQKVKEMVDKKQDEMKELEKCKLQNIEQNDHHHNVLIDQQRKIKLSEIEIRKREMEIKKQRQEKCLETHKKVIDEFKKSTEISLNRKMKKAEKIRMENELKELQNIKSMNKKEREKFEEIKKQLERQKVLEEEKVKEVMMNRMTKAEKQKLEVIAKEDKRLNAEALERNKKIVEIKKKIAVNDKKQQKQYLKAVSLKENQIRRAEEIVRTNFVHRSYKAGEQRNLHERKWKYNLNKIEQINQKHKEKTQQVIQLKESRVEKLQEVRKARKDLLKKQVEICEVERGRLLYKHTNFHTMQRKAVLSNCVGRGPRTALVNKSKVNLVC